MWPTAMLLRSQHAAAPTFTAETNPYKAKHPWPPEFANLSEKHQFRLERRYKRRAKLKWARPRLMVATKLAQWVCGVGVLVYGVLFMDWKNEHAFAGTREWYRQTVNSIWTTTPPRPRPLQQNQQPT